MQSNVTFDLIIIGGGIAGLWTLAAAKHRGFNAVLIEKNQLGSGQSIASQGIIHGGSKYALSGIISKAANNISDMPKTWQQALLGQGEVDLSKVTQLSDAQYLIPASGIDGKLLSFLGSKSMSSFTETVKSKKLPSGYQQIGVKRSCFKLSEIVLDTRTIFNTLLEQFSDCIYQADIQASDIQESSDSLQITIGQERISAPYCIIAAGNGNKDLPCSPMQQRPLQMVAMHQSNLPAIYAHFIGRSSKPLLTITSHPSEHGYVWYMGGNLAENGVNLSSDEQIQETRQLIAKLLPNFNLQADVKFCTLALQRAEPQQSRLLRPDDAHVVKNNRIISGWPTKLALAPRFAEQALALLDIQPSHNNSQPLQAPKAVVADFPWSFS